MRSSSLSVLALCASLPATTTAFAQEAISLDPVVITSGFGPIEQARYGRASSILTAEEIGARGITTVQDALRAMPGVSVSSMGRSVSSVRIRGGESNHTLILIDGVNPSGSGDEYFISSLETDDIARIEVLRGPQGVYYGSNASAGVVNIVTKKAEGNHWGGKLEAGNGHLATLWAETRGEKGGLRLSLSDNDDKGVDESGSDGERDFSDRQTLRLSGDAQLSEQLSLRAQASSSKEHYGFDREDYMAEDVAGFVVDDPLSLGWRRESMFSTSLAYESLDRRQNHELAFARSDLKMRGAYDYMGYAPSDWSHGRTKKLSYRGSFGLDGAYDEADQKLYLMVEREENKSNDQPDRPRDMNSYAVEYRGAFDNGLSLQAGLRHDDNKVYDDFTSFNLAAAYQLNDQWRLHGSLGRASVKPSFYDLYGAFGGNPDLLPEENRSIDAGVEFTSADGRAKIDVTAFSEILVDEVEYKNGLNVNNEGKSRHKGVEVSGQWQAHPQLGFGVSYTYLDAHNADHSIESRRPRHELGLNARWSDASGKLTLAGDLRYIADNFDTVYVGSAYGETQKLPNATVVSLAASYKLNEGVALTGRLQNVFDEDYSDVWGYRAQDRAVWLGLTASF